MRVLRHYDEKGRIEADELISEDVDRPLPKEFPNEFNDAQRKAILRLMNRAFGTSKSTYKYDERGRVIEKRINGRASGDEVTSIHYNDHGDVIDEVVVRTPNPEMRIEFSLDVSGDMVPKGPPRDEPPMRSEVRYEYEYDAQGNWTKKSTAWRSESNTDFKESTVVPRMITYY
jgi:YD repeat-containing protein